MTNKKVYAFDLDGTLCHTPGGNNYAQSTPLNYRIIRVNQLFAKGHEIVIYTARGCKSGCTPELIDLTKKQLASWKISHTRLVMGQKIFYDKLIDDKAVSDIQWEREDEVGQPGIIAGSFDIIHPGYIKMFDEASKVCSRIIVALQEKGKREPLLSVEDRTLMLLSLRQVSKVIPYKTEKDLFDLLKLNCPHVRILGNDYVAKDFTGMELKQDVYFCNRDHEWSTTKFLKKLGERNKNTNHGNQQQKSHNHRRGGVHWKPRS